MNTPASTPEREEMLGTHDGAVVMQEECQVANP